MIQYWINVSLLEYDETGLIYYTTLVPDAKNQPLPQQAVSGRKIAKLRISVKPDTIAFNLLFLKTGASDGKIGPKEDRNNQAYANIRFC